jgi:hypothetical protein
MNLGAPEPIPYLSKQGIFREEQGNSGTDQESHYVKTR